MLAIEIREAKASQNSLEKKNPLVKLNIKKELVLLLANEKILGPFMDFLKSTKVGGNKIARVRMTTKE